MKLENRLRIVVAGLIGSLPMAGLTLHYLQYILGLRSLGHQVLYLEDTGTWYYNSNSDSMVDDPSIPISYLDAVMQAHGLRNAWTFVDLRGESFGLTGRNLNEFLGTADLFVHVTGGGIMRDEYLKIHRRAYIDTDPGFIQMRAANGSAQDLAQLSHHTTHFSFGQNIGAPYCLIPTLDIGWHPTVQPLCLDLWTAPPVIADAPFTTVLKWKTYDAIEFHGEVYGPKTTEFMKFIDLPRFTKHPIELATDNAMPVSLDKLREIGWRWRNSVGISASLDRYREYIRCSRGEWTIAKSAYVKTRSGWFGDRSASYLACGRPVVIQDTGFSDWLETGSGVIAFNTPEEAIAGMEEINRRYDFHCRAAREIAQEYFDACKVLPRLIQDAMEQPGH